MGKATFMDYDVMREASNVSMNGKNIEITVGDTHLRGSVDGG